MLAEVIAFLTPFFTHEGDHETVLAVAFQDTKTLLSQINYSGSSYEFVTRLILTLQYYGESTQGTQSLWQFLTALKGRVGLDQQKRIDTFETWANTSRSLGYIADEEYKLKLGLLPSKSRIRVYIVDDHQIVRQGFLETLNNFDDFEVVGDSGDARFGVEEITQLKPDIVLMDIAMPIMNGMVATKLILKHCLQTRVIILTSFAEEKDVIEAVKSGVAGYMLKNASVDEVANAIRRVQGSPFHV